MTRQNLTTRSGPVSNRTGVARATGMNPIRHLARKRTPGRSAGAGSDTALRRAAIGATLVAVLCLTSGAAAGRGQIYLWEKADAAWHVSANWNPDGVPGADDWAVIDNGGIVRLTTTENCYRVFVGSWSESGSGEVRMTSGSLTTGGVEVGTDGEGIFRLSGGTLSASVFVGHNDTGDGEFYLSGSGELDAGNIHVGRQGVGKFIQEGGSASTPAGIGWWFCVGGKRNQDNPPAAGTGTYTMTGGTLYSWDSIIGGDGHGTFNHLNGWYYVEDTMHLGRCSGGEGEYNLDGPDADLDVGGASGGCLTLGPSGTGTFNLKQGSLDAVLIRVYPGSEFNAESDWTYHRSLQLLGGDVNVETANETPKRLTLDKSTSYPCAWEVDDGTLTTGWLIISDESGPVTFTQTGGTVKAYETDGDPDALSLGGRAGGMGTYNLSGSDSSLKVFGCEDIGREGEGHFTHTSGTHDIISSGLFLGRAEGAIGTYNLSGIPLPFPDDMLQVGGDEHVGHGGQGTFIQTGGDHAVGGDLYFATEGIASSGSYELYGSESINFSLTVAGEEYVGHRGAGTFTQLGGTHETSGDLYFGRFSGATGEYELGANGANPGTLSVGPYDRAGEHIGYAGTGSFTQTDHSTHLVHGDLALGCEASGQGSYHLSGEPNRTKLDVWGGEGEDSSEYIGGLGSGTFIQDGGTHTIKTDLYIGYEVGSVGMYYLNEGELSAGGVKYIGYKGTGTLIQTNGQNHCDFYLGYHSGGDGTCVIGGGTCDAETFCIGREGSGTLNIENADAGISVSEKLTFGPQSTFTAVPGATIQMAAADFEIKSTDPDELEGLNSLSLIFDGGSAFTAAVEVGGRDYGAVESAFTGNFALGALIIGGDDIGRVEFVDDYDNQPDWEGDEVLYVHTLEIGSGSYLDLNGVTVYYAQAVIDDDATVVLDGGGLIPVPCDWSEDFDNYDTSTPLPEQSTWEAWDDEPPGADFYATTDQAHSEPNSVVIDSTDDAVHRYAGYSAGRWEYSAQVYVTEQFDDVQYFILLNDYPASEYHDWSLQIELDGASNLIRDHNGPDSLPMVKGQWAALRVVIDLDQDLQSVYYSGAHLVTKGWTDGVEPGGALNIAAVNLYGTGSAYEVYYDDLSLEEAECPGDFDGDGDVDTADLLHLLGAWGTPDGDVDGDGDTDTADLLALLGKWGECP